MHITLRHLRIFEAVARHSSISRAADEPLPIQFDGRFPVRGDRIGSP